MIREDWNIHQQRCDVDPMYRLLFFPNERLHMSDGTQPRYIDHLLNSAVQMLRKRYGTEFDKAMWLNHVLPDLLDPEYNDTVVKTFALLFILHRNPSLAEPIFELYDSDSEYDLFAMGGNNHFYQFLKYVGHCIELHLNHAPNKYTIVQELKGFVLHMQQEYVMGPRPLAKQ